MSRARFLATLAGRVPLIAAQLAAESALLRTVATRNALAGEAPWGMRYERIGAEWLTGVLRERGVLDANATVERMHLERFGECGQMSVVFRVNATYSAGARGPATLVLKSTAPEVKNRVFNSVFRVFEKEVRSYQLPEPERGLLRPKCWYAAQHPTTRTGLLLLEDLCDWRAIPMLQKLTADEALRATKALAEHHARWWNDASLRARGFTDTHAICRESTGPMFALAWTKAERVMAPLIEPELLATLGDYVERQDAFSERLVRGATTFVHGDLNSNNLFFDDARDRVCAIDWQAGHIGHWAEDLAYLLLMGLDAETLAVHESTLLAAHHEVLAANGVLVDQAEHEAEYALGLIAAGGILIVASIIIDPKKDPDLYERYRTTVAEWSTAARRRRVPDVMASLDR